MSEEEVMVPKEVTPLPYLKTFLFVASAGSIARSAAALFRAASAVSRAVTELERVLGVDLFERKPQGLLLNTYGDAVLARARRIDDEIRLAADDFCRSGRPLRKTDLNAVTNLLYSGRKVMLFVGLAQYKQVSSVARALRMSQSGVSMFLSRLEDTLKQPLFHRMAQGLVPTDPAAALLLRAKRVLAELRHLESDLSAIRGNIEGTVTIGALPLCRTLILPVALAAALADHPRLRVKTFESPYEVLINALKNGDIDFVFGALRPPELCQGIRNEALFVDRIALVARKGHPLSGRSDVTMAELSLAKWALPRQDTPSRQSLEICFRDAGLEPPHPSVETGDLAILRMLLQSSDMITAISPRQLCFEIGSGAVAELDVDTVFRPRQIGLITRDGALLSPAAEKVLSEIRALVRRQICDLEPAACTDQR